VREGADLRRERELARPAAQVKRFDAESIARQDQLAGAPIEDREGEHPFEALAKLDRAEVLVAVDQDLGVGGAAEDVTLGGQQGAQRSMIVDLAVVDDLHLAVLVGHGLAALRAEIDDRQPPHSDADAVLRERAPRIGPAVRQRRRHGDDLLVADGGTIPADNAGNAAHGSSRRL
jgi:hypothetical protein